VLEVLGDGARADVHRPGDGQVGPAQRGHLQDLQFTVGEVGQAVAGIGCQGGAGPLAAAGPPQGVAHRFGQDAQQRPVGLAEVRLSPVKGDRRQSAVVRRGQREDDLVLNRDVPEKFRVKTQPMKLVAIEKVAYLDGLAAARGAVVGEQRMLVKERLEGRERCRVHRFSWILRVIGRLIRAVRNLVVCDDIRSHQPGQARQRELGHFVRPVRLVQVGEAVKELRCSVERVQ
jgi:hypothetical protein